MNGTEAIEYIHSVSWLGSRPGLERIRELTARMGSPEKSLRFIHVGGTNGKGSFCSMLSSILTHAGYKTGLFTSPYVLCFNERIRIDGEMIPDDALGEVTEYVKGFADEMDEKPTEFELLTAIAFEYFKREGCELVVLEVGLGGRLDSTNIITSPVLSVITGVDLDHTSVLGETVEEIALEKCGIIKHGCPAVFGEGVPSVHSLVREVARERNSALYTVDYEKLEGVNCSLDGTSFRFNNEEYSLSLLGEYQTRNAATVLTAVCALRDAGVAVPQSSVRSGLASAKWAARFELLSKSPVIIYDGAHNPQGIAAAKRNIHLFFGASKVVFITGVMGDKDHDEMTRTLAPLAHSVHTVTPDNARSMRAEDLASRFAELGVTSAPHADFASVVAAAASDAERMGLPVVALGSLYMYADVLGAVREYLARKADQK